MASPMTLLRVRRSSIALLLLLAYLPACTSWHVGTPTPEAFIQREHPKVVRVTRIDGTRVTLTNPILAGDSLTGLSRPSDYIRDTTRVTIALSDVQSVAVEKFSAGKALIVAGAVVGALLIIWVADCSGRSGWDALGCP